MNQHRNENYNTNSVRRQPLRHELSARPDHYRSQREADGMWSREWNMILSRETNKSKPTWINDIGFVPKIRSNLKKGCKCTNRLMRKTSYDRKQGRK